MEINNFLDTIKNKYQIVVSRYNEDIKWLLPFKLITIIYNKGDDKDRVLHNFNTIKLKNIGRESHTYLYHIVNNYNNLKERTIFIQGRINDHKVLDFEDYFKDTYDFIAKTSNLKTDKLKTMIEHYGKWSKEDMQKCEYTPYDWIEKVIGINMNEIMNDETKVIWGANFSVSKEMILRKPKIFYENLLRFLDNHINPEEGHYMERAWYILFHHSYFKKNTIAFIFFKYNIKHLELENGCLENIENNIYEDLHLWIPIKANYEYGKYYKIRYTPNNNKYNLISPTIYNNSFYIDIKGTNDAHILVTFNNNSANPSNIEEDPKYEIVIGGWNNNISVIRDYNHNKIIASYENVILDKNIFLRLNINFNEKITANIHYLDEKHINTDIGAIDTDIGATDTDTYVGTYLDANIENCKKIFDIDNIYNGMKIKSIMIKSYFGGDIFWNYDFNGKDIYLCNNIYEENNIMTNIYNKYYAEYYIQKIDLDDLI